EQPIERQAMRGNRVGDSLAVDQLHGEKRLRARLFDAINRDDVWMVERGDRASLSLKPLDGVRVRRRRRQEFDRDVALEFGIPGAIDLAHAARADGGDYFIRSDAGAWCQSHRRTWAWARRSTLFSARG